MITPVGMDHMDWLGDDITTIAGQKAGIIKPGMLVVVAEQEPAVADVLLERAATHGRDGAVVEGVDFGVVGPPRGGRRAAADPAGASAEPTKTSSFPCTVRTRRTTQQRLSSPSRRSSVVVPVRWTPRWSAEGFAAVAIPGRLEMIRNAPAVLLDVAHNPHGAAALVEAVTDSFNFSRMVGVVGVLGDKDAEGILVGARAAAGRGGRHPVVVTEGGRPR